MTARSLTGEAFQPQAVNLKINKSGIHKEYIYVLHISFNGSRIVLCFFQNYHVGLIPKLFLPKIFHSQHLCSSAEPLALLALESAIFYTVTRISGLAF